MKIFEERILSNLIASFMVSKICIELLVLMLCTDGEICVVCLLDDCNETFLSEELLFNLSDCHIAFGTYFEEFCVKNTF